MLIKFQKFFIQVLLLNLKFGCFVYQFRILERSVIRSFSFVGFKPSLALLYYRQRLNGFFRLALSPKIFCFGDAVSDDFWTSSSKSSSFQLAMAFRLLVPKVLAFSDGFQASSSEGSSFQLVMTFRLLVPKVLAFSDTANNVLGLHQQGKENVNLSSNFGDTISNDFQTCFVRIPISMQALRLLFHCFQCHY